MNKPWWKSSTILGAILGAAAHALTAEPSQRVTAVVEAVGIVIAAFGARTAIAKNGSGQ